MAEEIRGEIRLTSVALTMLAVVGALVGGGVGIWAHNENGVPYGFAVFLAFVGGVGLPGIFIRVVEDMKIRGE